MQGLLLLQRRRIWLDPASETAYPRAELITELSLLDRCLTAGRPPTDRIGAGHPFEAIEPTPMPVQVKVLGPHR
jgi:hypothetical protein